MHCWVHVLLTQPSQLPVSQPGSPKGLRASFGPQHFAKAMAGHSHTWRAQSQSHDSPTPPNCPWAHTRPHHPAAHSCPAAGAQGPRASLRVTQCHTGAVPPPREPEHTHPATFQHFPALSGSCGAAARRLGGVTKSSCPSKTFLQAACRPYKELLLLPPKGGAQPGRAGCPGSRARELVSDG